MRRAEIDALVRAHHDRAQPVAFFHVLRQTALGPDDHAFLLEHVDVLGYADLVRWRARASASEAVPIRRRLAALAVEEPASFRHEVLDAPGAVLDDADWSELADLLRGKVPDDVWQRLLARGAPARPPAPAGLLGLGESRALAPPLDLGGDESLDLDALGLGDLGDEAPAAELGPAEIEAALASDRDLGPLVDRLPDGAKDAILARARRTTSPGERVHLLGWLASRKVPRRTIVEIAIAAIRSGEIHPPLVALLASMLATRAAWEKEAIPVISALLVSRAFAELGDLFTLSLDEAGRRESPPGAAPRGVVEAAQVAFAHALLGLVREAVSAGDVGRATAALSALACLDPPSRLSRAVRELGRFLPEGDAFDDVRALAAVNERLVKHGDARDASLEGIVAAIHALADATR